MPPLPAHEPGHGVALSAATPHSVVPPSLAGFSLQSLTRASRSLIAFLFGTVVFFSGCSDDSNTSVEDSSAHIEERSDPEGNSCNDLPTSFTSYTEAMDQIRSASFRIAEEQNTDESSWVRGAEYYSCNGSTGFFILRTDDRDYIHIAVPLAVWHGFKEASSFGSYYTTNIKRRYRFGLN
ncbi:MAG: KTSC domain-containing protein [Flavobacteriales bacterium]|nr:KTSC domain-containing protein [Flavobacteriales bacterium]